MENEQFKNSIVKAIGYTENGGKPNINNPKKGKTGETASIFQFTPATWKNYSQQVFGKQVPMTADNETHVVQQKVGKWVDTLSKEGDDQDTVVKKIASMWNAGVGEPDAYTGKFSDGSPSAGINKKYGVKYDVPQYADKVANYTNEFLSQGGTGNTASTPPSTEPNLKSVLGVPQSNSASPGTAPTQPNLSGFLSSLAIPKTGSNPGMIKS